MDKQGEVQHCFSSLEEGSEGTEAEVRTALATVWRRKEQEYRVHKQGSHEWAGSDCIDMVLKRKNSWKKFLKKLVAGEMQMVAQEGLAWSHGTPAIPQGQSGMDTSLQGPSHWICAIPFQYSRAGLMFRPVPEVLWKGHLEGLTFIL